MAAEAGEAEEAEVVAVAGAAAAGACVLTVAVSESLASTAPLEARDSTRKVWGPSDSVDVSMEQTKSPAKQ